MIITSGKVSPKNQRFLGVLEEVIKGYWVGIIFFKDYYGSLNGLILRRR